MPENPNVEDVREPASPARANPPQTNPAPPSPVRTATPPPTTASPDVEITHTAKAEKVYKEKGKWSTELSGLADMSAQELYSGYLNRLHTGRDYEAGLINMMKDKYEVIPCIFF